jgi:hypothetical protein
MALHNDCIIYSGRKKDCPVSEKGKTYRIINNSGFELKVYQVDPCLINENNQQKCDYLFVISEHDVRSAYFIELKGTGLTDAINQIMNSVNFLYKSVQEYKLFGRIVGKNVTPNIKSRRAKLDEKLKQFGGNLKISCGVELKETI